MRSKQAGSVSRDMQSEQLQGTHAQKGPALGLMLCCHCLETLDAFKTRSPYFHFVLGSGDGAAGPETGGRSSRSGEPNPGMQSSPGQRCLELESLAFKCVVDSLEVTGHAGTRAGLQIPLPPCVSSQGCHNKSPLCMASNNRQICSPF